MLKRIDIWKKCVGVFAAVALSAALVPVTAFADQPAGSSDEAGVTSGITDEDIALSLVGIDGAVALADDTDEADIGVDTILTFSGSNRYETNALQALSGWDSSEYAILTTGQNWADALAASGLAGALDCPILMTKPDALPSAIRDTVSSLGVQKVIIIGGYGAVSEEVESELGELGVQLDARLSGSNRYDTQVAIFEYGLEHELWEPGELIVACGADGCFADALSVAPVAYAQARPVFLTDATASLSSKQEGILVNAARQGLFTSAVLLGGDIRVSPETEGFLWAVVQLSSGNSKSSTRLAGKTRWETSALIAEWAISSNYLKADGVGFASGNSPYDALGGGALMGKNGSIMLLVGDGNCDQALSVLPKNSELDTIRFFGGTGAISQNSRDYLVEMLGMGLLDVSVHEYGITLDYAVTVESESSGKSYDSILAKMDPSLYAINDSGFYQFAILSDGYSGAVSSETIDAYLDWVPGLYQETYWGVTSTLRGEGASFIAAAEDCGVNEVYLLAHAGIESSWGCSPLSQGTYYDGEYFYLEEEDADTGEVVVTKYEYAGYDPGTYYNYFGIGAYDSAPFEYGIRRAIYEGWNSPQAAIEGGAEWISANYTNPTVATAEVSGQQNTLYKMRWDVARIEATGTCSHQYATSLTWAEGIAATMSSFYSKYGLDIYDTGLRFEIPSYASE